MGTETAPTDTHLRYRRLGASLPLVAAATVPISDAAAVRATAVPPPANFHAVATTTTQVDLSWDASTDTTVTGYAVVRDGAVMFSFGID